MSNTVLDDDKGDNYERYEMKKVLTKVSEMRSQEEDNSQSRSDQSPNGLKSSNDLTLSKKQFLLRELDQRTLNKDNYQRMEVLDDHF